MSSDLVLATEMENDDDVIFDDTDLELLEPDTDLVPAEDENEISSEEVIRISAKDIRRNNRNEDEGSKGDNKDEFDKLDAKIDELPGNFPKALPIIKSDIAPVIATLEESLIEYYADKLKKKTGALKKPIMDEINLAKQNISAKESETETDGIEEIKDDPEIQQSADEIAQDPLLFKNKIEIINQLGVINERKPIGLYLVTIDSRCLPMGSTGSEALATKNSGPYGAGKSHPMFACLKIYPKKAYHLITSGSDKSLYNIQHGLKHKCLILTEALQLQGDRSGDNELAYSIRSLVSEGSLTYQRTGHNADGKQVTIIQRMSGPTSLLTTTVRGRLEDQLEDRLTTVNPNVTSKQTQDILTRSADIAAGNVDVVDIKTINAWKLFHYLLEPVEVLIPFARDISDYVNSRGELPISARRAFKRVLSMIKTIATVYQKQRRIDDMGRVIAEIQDYALAYQLIEESFRKTLSEYNKYTDDRMKLIEEEGSITPRGLAMKTGVSGAAISQWTKQLVERGSLCWCNKKGMEFSDAQALEKAKRSGKAYVRVSRPNSLPTPYQLTGDPKWDVGGEYYQMYDLELECLDKDEDSGGSLNTSDDSYDVEDDDGRGDGVKVLSEKSDIKNKNGDSGDEPWNPETPILNYDQLFQDLDDYFEQDEGGEVDIPIDAHATFSECMLTSEPC